MAKATSPKRQLVNVKAALVPVFIGGVVLTIALLACRSQVDITPTDTPKDVPPEVTAQVEATPTDAPTEVVPTEAHAQDLSQACEKATASSHFDLVQTVTRKPLDGGESDGTESTLHVAGADYHWTRESYDGTKFEGIYAGGVGYRRDGSSPWVEHKTLDHQSTAGSFGVDFTAQGWSICPQLDLAEDKGWVEKMGEENLDGVTTTVYATSHDVVAPSPTDANYTINVALHFWVDETGQLVQFRNVQRFPPSPVESMPGFTVSIVTKVSGVGEPNTITAPVVGE